MPRRSRRQPEPEPATTATYGPQRPVQVKHGADRLRAVLELSADVDLDRLCEDAASEIEYLRTLPKPII